MAENTDRQFEVLFFLKAIARGDRSYRAQACNLIEFENCEQISSLSIPFVINFIDSKVGFRREVHVDKQWVRQCQSVLWIEIEFSKM